MRYLPVGIVVAVLLAPGGPARGLELDRSAGPLPADVKTSCYRKLLCFHTVKGRRGVESWVEALTDTPITFTMRTSRENLTGAHRDTPVVLDRPRRVHMAKLRPAGPGGWSYFFKYTYHPGRPDTARPDTRAVYELPFAPGRRFRVTQGQHTTNTHKKREKFAVDWGLPVGTPIHAARGGTVAGAGGWSNLQKRGRGNFIWIRHADGTYAWYLHLKQGGVLVKRGDEVRAGQHIGYSGNTGKTSGPHLHFQVSMPTSGRYAFMTIPFKLRTDKGIVTKVRSGDRHRRPKN